jgi:hypothetical protein
MDHGGITGPGRASRGGSWVCQWVRDGPRADVASSSARLHPAAHRDRGGTGAFGVKALHKEIGSGLEKIFEETIPIARAGLIVAYPRSAADKVEATVTRALQKVVGEVEGHYVKALRGAPSPTPRRKYDSGHPQIQTPFGHGLQRAGSSGVRRDLLDLPRTTPGLGTRTHTPTRPCLYSGRDLLNDLLLSCVCSNTSCHLHGDNQKSKVVARGAAGTVTKLTRVLEGTLRAMDAVPGARLADGLTDQERRHRRATTGQSSARNGRPGRALD